MSHVTSLILVSDVYPMDGRADWLRLVNDGLPSGGLMPILDGYAGGNKAPQIEIAVGAFNYLDHAAFATHLRSLPWVEGDVVQLVVNGEHDSGAYIIDIIGKPDIRGGPSGWIEGA